MMISLEGNDFAEAVVFVDDAFVENSGFVVVRLVHVFTNKIIEGFCGHDGLLEIIDWTGKETPQETRSCGVGKQGTSSPRLFSFQRSKVSTKHLDLL